MKRRICITMLLVLVVGFLLGVMGNGIAWSASGAKMSGKQIAIPRIDNENGWQTWAQVQNVGANTGVVVFFWGEYSELCPSNNPGPQWHGCRLVSANSAWTLRDAIPEGAKSAIAYSVNADIFQEACEASGNVTGDHEAWISWINLYTGTGEDLTAVIHRSGPNDFGTTVTSAYEGISENMVGEENPYQYYAHYLMKEYHDLDTEMTIQNVGTACAQFSIHYREQGFPEVKYTQRIEVLAPGEAIRLKVPEVVQLGGEKGPFLGSAFIRSPQPLAIAVDEGSDDDPELMDQDRAMLLSYRAAAYPLVIPNTEVYAGLLFREWSGWSTSVQVQNMGDTGQPAFVVVEFLDSGGGQILYLADWVCTSCSATFYLPIVASLGNGYIGAAEIYSYKQIGYPGGEVPEQDIDAVVEIKSQGDMQGGTYTAHPRSRVEGVTKIVAPAIAKKNAIGVTSFIAIRNNSNCVRNKVVVEFRQDNGETVCFLENWISPKHLWFFDLKNIGCIVNGWEGGAIFYITDVIQLCDVNGDGHVDTQPVIPSVIIMNKGTSLEGDVTSVYDGIPVPDATMEMTGTTSISSTITLTPTLMITGTTQ